MYFLSMVPKCHCKAIATWEEIMRAHIPTIVKLSHKSVRSINCVASKLCDLSRMRSVPLIDTYPLLDAEVPLRCYPQTDESLWGKHESQPLSRDRRSNALYSHPCKSPPEVLAYLMKFVTGWKRNAGGWWCFMICCVCVCLSTSIRFYRTYVSWTHFGLFIYFHFLQFYLLPKLLLSVVSDLYHLL